jgi:hypothetical protein
MTTGISESFQTIKYKYFVGKNTSTLFVILPLAGGDSSYYTSLIPKLMNLGNVICIESGYFGTTLVDNPDLYKELSVTTFRDNLHNLLKKFNFEKLYLLGESVGALHAVAYCEKHPEKIKLLILGAPAIYRARKFLTRIHILITNILLSLPINFLFNSVLNMLLRLPSENLKQLGKSMRHVKNRIGAKSYTLCLKEIALFPLGRNEVITRILKEKSVIFLGNDDKVFQMLCDRNLCMNSIHLVEVPYGHRILNNISDQVIEEILNNS